MQRRMTFFVVLVVALLIELTVAPEIGIGSVKPDILLVATVCWALFQGPGQGALFGFFAGLLEGIFSTAVLGVSAFAKTFIGYFGGELRQRVISKSVMWPMLIVFVASAVHELMKFATWAIVGLEQRPPFSFGVIAGLALYNALITLVVFPVIGRFTGEEDRALMFQ